MKIILTESQYSTLLNEVVDFNSLYKSLYPKMYRQVCLKYANGDEEKANDFCQLGFIKVYQKISMYNESGSIEAWAKRVITNTVIDEWKKEKRSPYKNPIDFERVNLEVIDDTPEESLYSSKEIKDAVETLYPSQKKVFEMFFFENMKHQEIAEELGISESTSKSNLFKAKAKIKQYLINLNKKRED
jgi:RNA polymerase sigma-70 factor (ECF subfamily)